MTPALDLLKKFAPNIGYTAMNMTPKRRRTVMKRRKSLAWRPLRCSRRCWPAVKRVNYWWLSYRSSEVLT